VKYTLIALGMMFVGSVVLSSLHPFGNPRVESTTEPRRGLDTLLQNSDIPTDARHVLITRCADCHSNETRWPAYSRLAPASWLIERDIVQGRAKMNLSHWEAMTPDERDVLIAKMIQETRGGEMPPLQYRIIHWSARLTPADLAAIRSMSKTPLNEQGTTPATAGDAARGKLVFDKRCTGCHAMDGDREGPRLAGLFGRKAGSISGFTYSAGLKKSGLTWSEATLDKWLTDPDLIAPDTTMDFHVPRAQERADLIAFLRQ
jgi:cytochrome c